jgi:hypothetical protein
MVCGFDSGGVPHIFVVRNPGYVELKNPPGYWAIGNGAWAAMSILGYFEQSIFKPLADSYYNVWAAKLMAESASDVGSRSFCFRVGPDGVDVGDSDTQVKIQMAAIQGWKMQGKPQVPETTIKKIRDLIQEAAAVDTEEAQ